MKGGIIGFLYLEVLDASFSFDGVIGAFAITNDVIVIMLGLAIGAMFVRSMTIFLVDKGTLDEFVYLEHGAHYAIGALAIIMLIIGEIPCARAYHWPYRYYLYWLGVCRFTQLSQTPSARTTS